jgi:broad specificity phosphatase PhoE
MLILLRHGQSESNAAGLLVGRSDPPLTDLGVRQAEAAGRYLAAELLSGERDHPPRSLLVLSSPLQRARATAEIVARECGQSAEVEVDEQLIELDYGKFDGLTLGQVEPADWAAWRADPSWRPPGGDGLVRFAALRRCRRRCHSRQSRVPDQGGRHMGAQGWSRAGLAPLARSGDDHSDLDERSVARVVRRDRAHGRGSLKRFSNVHWGGRAQVRENGGGEPAGWSQCTWSLYDQVAEEGRGSTGQGAG